MALTCDRCLHGQPERCRRGDCAQWLARHKPTAPRKRTPVQRVVRERKQQKQYAKPKYKSPTGTKRGEIGGRQGRPPGVTGGAYTREQGHEAATMLLDGIPKREIASAVGITYEQVRTVLRTLKEFNGVNVRRKRKG